MLNSNINELMYLFVLARIESLKIMCILKYVVIYDEYPKEKNL